MNALQSTIKELRTLTLGQIAEAQGRAAARMTQSEFAVFSAAVRYVEGERRLALFARNNLGPTK